MLSTVAESHRSHSAGADVVPRPASRRSPDHRRSASRSPRSHVFAAALFNDIVRREHRRSERSGQTYALLQVGLRDRTDATRMGVERAVVEAADRDALVGWIRDGAELAFLLTDLGLDAPSHLRSVERRLEATLTRELGTQFQARADVRTFMWKEGHESLAPVLDDALASGRPRFHVTDALKRAVDIVGSVLLLLLFSPVLLVAALLIKLTSPGPVLFRQVRIGQGARRFTMLKFRTMTVNADPALHRQYVTSFIKDQAPSSTGTSERPLFKISNDPRITPVGRFLRRTSLDELPQFFNVLKGEMSLVGPRPPLDYEHDNYRSWHRRRVLDAKPGVTGLWQVKGRSRTTFDEMVRMDLQYARSRSLWLDLRILLATPVAMITGKGAY